MKMKNCQELMKLVKFLATLLLRNVNMEDGTNVLNEYHAHTKEALNVTPYVNIIT